MAGGGGCGQVMGRSRVLGRVGPACIAALLIAVGCAYLPPGEKSPVLSRVPATFRVEGRPVIHILLDGCRPDVLYDMGEKGELPNIRDYFLNRGIRVERGVASLTSTTFAAVSAQLTGKTPAHMDFPGNGWFDRRSFILRKINSRTSVTRINTDIIGPTIGEIVALERPKGWSAVIGDTLDRGAQFSNPLREWLGICYFLKRWRIVDRIALETFHDIFMLARVRGTFPAYTFVHLIATDNAGHLSGPTSDEYRETIRHEDAQIGRLMRTLEQSALIDKVCVVITADHGMAPVEAGCTVVWHKYITEELGIRCAHDPVEEDVPLADREMALKSFRAIETTSGDRYCFVYLSNPKNLPPGEANWFVRPKLEDLRKFQSDAGKETDLIDAFRNHPAVGLVCARDSNGDCHVFSSRGEGLIRRVTQEGQPRYVYTVKDGRDPLGYDSLWPGKPEELSKPRTADEWFAASCDAEYPDFVPEAYHLFDSPRTGDLVLFAARGWNFRIGHVGAHGDAARDDVRIPILMTGPGIERRVISRARAVDLVPTFLDYMGIKTSAHFDGKSFLK